MEFIIDPKTEIGVSEMYVKDLENMKNYYSLLVGLEVIDKKDVEITLGMNNRPILKLVENKNLEIPSRKSAGLYHNAILFEDRGHLSYILKEIIINLPQSYSGSADHIVSEAFYFNDPERNGLELYIDRPKDTWKWIDGQIVMGSNYIDVEKFINESKKPANNNAKMGHIHLKVGNIDQARKFYVDLLGFEIVANMQTALFVSAGGYHHHIGLNVWESLGAEERKETLGLKSFEILIKDSGFKSLEERLTYKKVSFKKINNSIEIFDPWKNLVRIISRD